MENILNDPIYNSINQQILRSINVCLENECFSASVILIFAGIDAMSNMNRPKEKKYSNGDDFKVWVDKYFHLYGETKITSEEWWAARNAIMHTFGAYSKLHKKQNIRILGWMVNSLPHIRFNPKISDKLVIVDIPAMRDAFSKGVQNFLIEVFADKIRQTYMEGRLKELIIKFELNS